MTPQEQEAGLVLARGVARGLWTLNDLDQPTSSFRRIEADRHRSASPVTGISLYEPKPGPTVRYPGAGTTWPWRNLAREWIAANPREWEALRTGAEPSPLGPDGPTAGTAATRERAMRVVASYDQRHAEGMVPPPMEHDSSYDRPAPIPDALD